MVLRCSRDGDRKRDDRCCFGHLPNALPSLAPAKQSVSLLQKAAKLKRRAREEVGPIPGQGCALLILACLKCCSSSGAEVSSSELRGFSGIRSAAMLQ